MFTLLACIASLIVVSSMTVTTKTERVLKTLSLGCFVLAILIEIGAFK